MGHSDTGVEDVAFQNIVSERITMALQDENGCEQLLLFAKAVSSELNQEDQSPGSGQLRMDVKWKVCEVGPLGSCMWLLRVGAGLMNQRSLECPPMVTVTSCFSYSSEWHRVKEIPSLSVTHLLCPAPWSHSLPEPEGKLRTSPQLPHTKDDRIEDQRRKVTWPRSGMPQQG